VPDTSVIIEAFKEKGFKTGRNMVFPAGFLRLYFVVVVIFNALKPWRAIKRYKRSKIAFAVAASTFQRLIAQNPCKIVFLTLKKTILRVK
jgi:hypothetical protein